MINRIIPLIFLSFTIISFGQTSNFPAGVYLNLEQLKNRTPAYDTNLSISKRTSGDIFMMGGNDYKIKSTIDSINKSYITKKMFAYVKNDSLYLNCLPHKLQNWYALCKNTSGNLVTFKACMSLDKAMNVSILSGGIGSGIAATKRFLYVLNLTNGEIFQLTEKNLLKLLNNKPDLQLLYEKETDRTSEQQLLKYIDQLNLNQ